MQAMTDLSGLLRLSCKHSKALAKGVCGDHHSQQSRKQKIEKGTMIKLEDFSLNPDSVTY